MQVSEMVFVEESKAVHVSDYDGVCVKERVIHGVNSLKKIRCRYLHSHMHLMANPR